MQKIESIELKEREKLILQSIIHGFILTANPVGSRFLSKNYNLNLSPATIRNVMADLEEMGYIEQPYTSAGRIPTGKGYRFYVNSLMMAERLSSREKRKIKKDIESVNKNVDEILGKTSEVLSRITQQLGVAVGPIIYEGIFEKLELIQISSNKIMIIISIQSGIVKTMMIEVKSEIPKSELEETAQIINERFTGLTLKEIKNCYKDRIRDISGGNKELIRLFINSTDSLFNISDKDFHLVGTRDILDQPEFSNADNVKSIIELVADKNLIVHLLTKNYGTEGVNIVIGEENMIQLAKDFSIISSNYYFGNVRGTVGVIGPTRMKYSRIVSLVDYISNLLNTIMESE